MHFDRFDIVTAYYQFFVDYHEGQYSEKYQRLSKIQGYFSPSPLWQGYESLSIFAQEIYDNLVEKYGY